MDQLFNCVAEATLTTLRTMTANNVVCHSVNKGTFTDVYSSQKFHESFMNGESSIAPVRFVCLKNNPGMEAFFLPLEKGAAVYVIYANDKPVLASCISFIANKSEPPVGWDKFAMLFETIRM